MDIADATRANDAIWSTDNKVAKGCSQYRRTQLIFATLELNPNKVRLVPNQSQASAIIVP